VGIPEGSAAEGDPVLAIYRRALPQVYGYLVPRCGSTTVAEDLTEETFLAAVASVADRRNPPDVTVAWLVGIARHKLVDHWRGQAREQRRSSALELSAEGVDDPWDEHVDVEAVHAALGRLSGPHRAALTLRYLDGLPVAEVASHLGRNLHATETLLVRARRALRHIYRDEGQDDA
jgi:RNA polymerase sigma-70 factor (ECF subfamily)